MATALMLGLSLVSGSSAVAGLDRLRPVAFSKAIPNEYNGGNGLGAAQVGATTHHVCYEDLPDGSFQVWYPHFGATSGQGEWFTTGNASARCSVMWIDQAGNPQNTQLIGAGNGSPDVIASPGGFFKFYGTTVRPKVGSHFWAWFYGVFASFGYYSHAKADYANGDALQYGASVPDRTGTTTFYTNTWTGGGDYYGPCFIGGKATRPTFVNDSDSQEASVLTPGNVVPDTPDTLHGAAGVINRLFTPFMAGIDISIPGSTLAEMADPTKTVRRDVLCRMADFRYNGLGVNGIISNGTTAAQEAAFEVTRKARLGGMPTRYKTINPAVTSASVNTPAQPARDPERIARNVSYRATSDALDPALILESGVTPGTYTGGAGKTVDGTHNTTAANKEAIAGMAYDVAAKTGAGAISAGFQYAASALYQSLVLSDGWSTQQSALTIGSKYSPDHKMTAALLKEDLTAASSHAIFKQITMALAGTSKTVTVCAKRVTGTRNVALQLQRSDFSGVGKVSVNLGTGAVFFTLPASPTAGITMSSTSVVAVDDYWKITMVLALDGTVPANPYIFVLMADGTGNDNYNGDNTSSLAIWGVDVR